MGSPSTRSSPEERARDELRRRLGEDWLDFATRWNEKQRAILTSPKQYNVVIGGNGSGKTTLGGWWLKGQLDNFNPISGKRIERQHATSFYAIAPTTEKLEGLIKPALARWLPKHRVKKWGNREMDCWTLDNGARVMWKTGRQDVSTFTGDEIDGYWIDEEISTEEHHKRILSRGFRRLALGLYTFTAENGTQWFHQWIFSPDEVPLDHKDIWELDTRENPYYHDCDHCSFPKAWHEENPRRKGVCAAFENTRGQLKLDLRMRQCRGAFDFAVRIQGKYMLMAGMPVIAPPDREKQSKLHQRDPLCGYLNEQLKFVELSDQYDSRAWLRLQVGKRVGEGGQKDRLYLCTPVHKHTYVIGVDAAEGNPAGDYHAAVVIDAETGEQCALAHSRSVPARNFGAFVCQLARWYNDAFVVVEANNHGMAVIDELYSLNYGNLYRRQQPDNINKKPVNKAGFWTNNKTKKPAVDLMAEFFIGRMKVHDPVIYAEAYNYTWLRETREGAHGVGNSNSSGHDDTMTALFCASVGLRQLGWANTSPEESPQRYYEKTVFDQLAEDAAGREMTDGDIQDLAEERDQAIQDVFAAGLEEGVPGEWIP